MALFFPYGEMAVFKFENVLFDGVGWGGVGLDGIRFGSFNFLKTLCYIDKVYTYLYTK